MTRRLLGYIVLFSLMLSFAQPTFADHTLTAHDDDGCQTYMPFRWTSLEPGEAWQAEVDISQCAALDLGWYTYYGYLSGPSWTRRVQVKDHIDVTVRDLTTGDVFTSDQKRKTDPVDMYIDAPVPTRYLLNAVNNGNKTVWVRFTWLKL